MRSAGLLAAVLVALTGLPLAAMQADAASGQSAATRQDAAVTVAAKPLSPGASPGTGSPAADRTQPTAAPRPPRMWPVHAQLMGSLDSRSAKAGAQVELRTQELLRIADGTEIPKNTKILGHVISVEAHGKGNDNALLAIQFDRAELKGGQSFAIQSAILTVSPPPDPSTANMLRSMDNMGGGVMGGPTQVMGGAHNGGLGAGANTGLTVTGGMVQATPKQTEGLGSAADFGVQAPSEPAGHTAAAGGIVTVGPAHKDAARVTGVSGVMLASDSSGKLSGTFSAVKQNVHLDGGTRVVLGLVVLK